MLFSINKWKLNVSTQRSSSEKLPLKYWAIWLAILNFLNIGRESTACKSLERESTACESLGRKSTACESLERESTACESLERESTYKKISNNGFCFDFILFHF